MVAPLALCHAAVGARRVLAALCPTEGCPILLALVNILGEGRGRRRREGGRG